VNDNGSVDPDAQLVAVQGRPHPTLPNPPSADVNNSGEVTSGRSLIHKSKRASSPLGSLHRPWGARCRAG
jgi:hypothetical protein